MQVERHTLAGVDVEAISVGGLETCIVLPREKIAFDIGRCPDEVIGRDRVFFTHAHMDHMAGVAYHCATRSLRGMPPPRYHVPRENVADFERLIDAWRALDRSDLPHRLSPIGPGDEVALPGDRLVRAFRTPHTAPCLGYALVRRRQKLLPELEGLAPHEIRDRRAAGEAVTAAQDEVAAVFSGDTRIELVEREEDVRKARLLILEVTFLDERVSVADCRRFGHVHLDEVVERAELFENEALLFTHFSARYRAGEIRRILDRRLPPVLQGRVTPLLAGYH